MLKYHKPGNIAFFIHILAFLLVACFMNENDNILFVFFIILTAFFIESQIRFFLRFRKKTEVEYKEQNSFIIKHVNEDISLLFLANKSDFKNRRTFVKDVNSITKPEQIWVDDKTLKITFTLTDPSSINLSDILFIERDLLHFHNINYIHCENKQSIIVLPEPVRNKLIEQKIIHSGHTSTSREHISNIRDYKPDDNFKNINWKQTSKRGKFQVNNYYSKDKPQIILIIDTFIENHNKSLSLLMKNLTHLLLYSPFKNMIKTVIFEGTNFDLHSDKEALLIKLADYKHKMQLFKKPPVFIPQKNTLILTTRKNLNMKNCIIIEDTL